MFGKNFANEIDNGSFFEQMDDLLDIDDAVLTTDFPPIWSSSAAAAADSLFSGHTHDSGHYDPYEYIVQSEWLSNCADNSFLGAGTLTVHTSPLTPSNQFQSSSPDSGEVCSCPGAAEKEKAWFRRDENGVRKCLHCEVTKTPQWRVGPLGPKTLCNACGVRYSSGRLFPEYRPAASPSFVPSLHSNSHKKVLQMRAKQTAGAHSDC